MSGAKRYWIPVKTLGWGFPRAWQGLAVMLAWFVAVGIVFRRAVISCVRLQLWRMGRISMTIPVSHTQVAPSAGLRPFVNLMSGTDGRNRGGKRQEESGVPPDRQRHASRE